MSQDTGRIIGNKIMAEQENYRKKMIKLDGRRKIKTLAYCKVIRTMEEKDTRRKIMRRRREKNSHYD